MDGFKGTIKNCYNEGNITTHTGYATGISIEHGSIDRCYNLGNITATSGTVAGITGYGQGSSNTIISNCYNLGTLTAADNCCAGGISVRESKKIYNCYNKGKIYGYISIGTNGYGIGRNLWGE